MYMDAIKKFPFLTVEEEQALAKRYAEDGDVEAARKLVTSHLRLAAKVAMGYRGRGMSMLDLISEANIGLMRAVKKFDPNRGFRLATYAIWWIKAAINEYIVNSWSMVKLGTVAAQRRLFFNLRKLKAKFGAYEQGDLAPEVAEKIATALSVPVSEVFEMNRRLAHTDSSLDQPASDDTESTRVDLLVDPTIDQERSLGEREELSGRMAALRGALDTLSPRERHIIEGRRLSDHPRTLEEIGAEYGISRERVRQIENAAFEKIKRSVVSTAAIENSRIEGTSGKGLHL
jgi:RNA polymerase sigma-32 factor